MVRTPYNIGAGVAVTVSKNSSVLMQYDYTTHSVEDTEAMDGDPLGDLAKQLMQEISERKIALEMLNK